MKQNTLNKKLLSVLFIGLSLLPLKAQANQTQNFIQETCPFLNLEYAYDKTFINLKDFWSGYEKTYKNFVGECTDDPQKMQLLDLLLNPKNIKSIYSQIFGIYKTIKRDGPKVGVKIPNEFAITRKNPYSGVKDTAGNMYRNTIFQGVQNTGKRISEILSLFYQPRGLCSKWDFSSWKKNTLIVQMLQIQLQALMLATSQLMGTPMWFLNPLTGQVIPVFAGLEVLRDSVDLYQSVNFSLKDLFDNQVYSMLGLPQKTVDSEKIKNLYAPLSMPPGTKLLSHINTLLPLVMPLAQQGQDFSDDNQRFTFRNQMCLSTIALRHSTENYNQIFDAEDLKELGTRLVEIKKEKEDLKKEISRLEALDTLAKYPEIRPSLLGDRTMAERILSETKYAHICDETLSENNEKSSYSIKNLKTSLISLNSFYGDYYLNAKTIQTNSYSALNCTDEEIRKFIPLETSRYGQLSGSEVLRETEIKEKVEKSACSEMFDLCQKFYHLAFVGDLTPFRLCSQAQAAEAAKGSGKASNLDLCRYKSADFIYDLEKQANLNLTPVNLYANLIESASTNSPVQKAKNWYITKLMCENLNDVGKERNGFLFVLNVLNELGPNKMNKTGIAAHCMQMVSAGSEARQKLMNMHKAMTDILERVSISYLLKQKKVFDELKKESSFVSKSNYLIQLENLDRELSLIYKVSQRQKEQRFESSLIYDGWRILLPHLFTKLDNYLDYLIGKSADEFESINGSLNAAERKYVEESLDYKKEIVCKIPFFSWVLCRTNQSESAYNFLDQFFSAIKKADLLVDPISNKPYVKDARGSDHFVSKAEVKLMSEIFTFGDKSIKPEVVEKSTLEKELVCFRITANLDKLDMSVSRARMAKSYCDILQKIVQQYGKTSTGTSVAIPFTNVHYKHLLSECTPGNKNSKVNQAEIMSTYAEDSAFKTHLNFYRKKFNCERMVSKISKGFRYRRSFGALIGKSAVDDLDIPGISDIDLDTLPGGVGGLGAFGVGGMGGAFGGGPLGGLGAAGGGALPMGFPAF